MEWFARGEWLVQRFHIALARHNDLCGAMLRRRLTEAEAAEIDALAAELEAIGEESASRHYGRV